MSGLVISILRVYQEGTEEDFESFTRPYIFKRHPVHFTDRCGRNGQKVS